MAGQADPKAGPRIVDREVLSRARLTGDECVSCHRSPSNVHHVIARGGPHYGDDVLPNLVLLCGSGTTGCHGALHGSTFTDRHGIRWTSELVRTRIGEHIKLRRPDTILYVLGKLGPNPGWAFLERHYHLTLG